MSQSIQTNNSNAFDGIADLEKGLLRQLQGVDKEMKDLELSIKKTSSSISISLKDTAKEIPEYTKLNKELRESVNLTKDVATSAGVFKGDFAIAVNAIDSGTKVFDFATNKTQALGKALSGSGSAAASLGKALGTAAPYVGVAVGIGTAIYSVVSAIKEAEKEAKDSLGLCDEYYEALDSFYIQYRKLSNSEKAYLTEFNTGVKERKDALRSASAEGGALLAIAQELSSFSFDTDIGSGSAYANGLVNVINKNTGADTSVDAFKKKSGSRRCSDIVIR